MKFYTPYNMSHSLIRIAVIGCGGTGGEVLDSLTRLDFGLKAMGHPKGIHVTVYDDDVIEAANVGRQRFGLQDVGLNKAITLVQRINLFYGFTWDAEPVKFAADPRQVNEYDLIIGCVDKAQFRAKLGEIGKFGYRNSRSILWLDYGNAQKNGQCVLGHLIKGDDCDFRLPNVFDLYPNLSDPNLDEDESVPRCSLAEALTGPNGQDLFINRTLADFGMSLLWELLTKGFLEKHGAFVDLETLKTAPLMIDPTAWAFFVYQDTSNAKAA